MPVFSASRIFRGNDVAILDKIRALSQGKTNWSDTLTLPQSQFPARPSPEAIEKYRQKCADELYAWQRQKRGRQKNAKENGQGEFVLHDGPPYANGAVHVGHAMNKILKDLILRWELSQGRKIHYRPGWDCHGLPIELKALQHPEKPGEQAKSFQNSPREEGRVASEAAKRLSASEIRAAARRLADETVEVQRASFKGWGVMGEWDQPYRTMDKDFEMRQLGVFRDMVRKGRVRTTNHLEGYMYKDIY